MRLEVSARAPNIGVLLALAIGLAGCRSEDRACKPSPGEIALASSSDEATEYAFVMGSTNERVGTILVWSDGTSLHVRYELFSGFELVSAHVCAAQGSFSWISPGSCPWTADNLPSGTTEYEIVIPLAEITSLPCGVVLTLQVHGAVRAAIREPGAEESAYAGSFRGLIEHTSSCEESPPAQPSPPPPPPPPPPNEPTGPACRLTQGFWKNHAESWPVRALEIGDVRYEQAELLELLRTPTGGDASLILGHQLIATELNVATGSAAPEPALAGARVWMTESADADGRLPYGVFESVPAYQPGIGLSETLDAYNNGEL